MGFFVFIIIVIGIIVLVVRIRSQKKKKEKEENLKKLNESISFNVAQEIKSKLIAEGYSVGNPIVEYDGIYTESPYGTIHICDDSNLSIGEIMYSRWSFFGKNFGYKIRRRNLAIREQASMNFNKYLFAVQFDSLTLAVYSTEPTDDVPRWLQISADILVEFLNVNGLAISDPVWTQDEDNPNGVVGYKKYLNTMFR